jgi:hypothetical protein
MSIAERPDNQRDPLDDFEARELTLLGRTRRVYVSGTGPAVIVMAEMPGIYPLVSRFTRRVRDAGFTVWMPSLFGDDGRPLTTGYMLRSMLKGCISREFRAFAANQSSPVIDWLRALAAHALPLCGGRGVGAMEPAMLAPVLSQPSLPIGKRGGMHIAPDELARVKERMEREDLSVLAYRFAGDAFCRAERFAAYEKALGDRFVGRVLPDTAANPDAIMKNPHSVVTAHLIDREGEPTRQALDEILGFFRQRLVAAA